MENSDLEVNKYNEEYESIVEIKEAVADLVRILQDMNFYVIDTRDVIKQINGEIESARS